MDIMDKARELGQMLADSPELLRLRQSETGLAQDEKAQTLMQEYRQYQIELVRATKATKDQEVLSDMRNRLLQKQQELNSYSVTNEYLEAKSAFDGLMKNVNNVLIYSITGEEPCSPSKCGSCSCSGCK